MNTVNYVILNYEDKKYIDSDSFERVMKLHYISNSNNSMVFTIGIYKPEFVDKGDSKRILSIEEIKEELSKLHLNAKFVKEETIR